MEPDDTVPSVLRAFPSITAIIFVWSGTAFHWMSTEGMKPWSSMMTVDDFPHRSIDNAWAVFFPATVGPAPPSVGASAAKRLLGPNATKPWILINMAAFGDESLLEWKGETFDFFTTVYLRTLSKNPTLVSLNTPESVLTQLYGAYEQPPPTIYWLDSGLTAACPDFTRSYFETRADEQEWWDNVVEHTQVDLRLLPPFFDPDTEVPPSIFWKK